jgi:hypothetical protein
MLVSTISSSAMAVNTFRARDVYSENTSSGPSVYLGTSAFNGGYYPSNYSFIDDMSGQFDVNVSAYIENSRTTGNSSDHYVELNVQEVQPVVGDIYVDYIYVPNLMPATSNTPYPINLAVSAIYSYLGEEQRTVFHIWVYAECVDGDVTTAYYTWQWNATLF